MGWRPFLEPDEGRYAEIPREMSATGDWVTPRLNAVKYFEKPPLQYWATAALDTVFGPSEWSARFWSCALAFLCIPLAYGFAHHLYGTEAAGIGAATILGMSPFVAIVGQLNLLDSGLAFFLTASMFAFLRARAEPPGSRSERLWMLASSVTLGLAILSKGIVAVVLGGGTLAVHMLVTGEVRSWRRWHLPVTVPALLLITVPWFVVVSLRNPEFPEFFFIHEHLARYLTDVSDRVQPWWYFLPMLLVGVLPFTACFVRAAQSGWRSGLRNPANSDAVFLWIWCAFVLLFFSASHSKLPPYILPLMPALAVLIAPQVIARLSRIRIAAWICFTVIGLVAAALVMAARRHSAPVPGALAAGAVLAIVVAGAGALAWRLHWLVPIAAVMLAFQALIVSYTALPPVRTAKPLLAAVRASIGPQTVLFSVGQYRQSVPPYLGRTLRVALYQGELGFGLAQEDVGYIETLEEFNKVWAAQSNAVAFVDPSLMTALRAQHVPLRELATDGRSIAIARR
jgi:4-amino-4-deoxy-L-arabinose transferase-like glycosyltransferase